MHAGLPALEVRLRQACGGPRDPNDRYAGHRPSGLRVDHLPPRKAGRSASETPGTLPLPTAAILR